MHNKPLILWGGTDIQAKLYNQEPLPTTQRPDKHRDDMEWAAIKHAIDHGKPIIGICRGAQLLCAFMGGTLLQHVPSHNGNPHPIINNEDQIFKNVAADHHQIMQPAGDFEIIAKSHPDYMPEVVRWPTIKALGIQAHPEWMDIDHPFNAWINGLIVDYFGSDVFLSWKKEVW
jgi:gamma-glutamyl-gamma-aminobutyrate hydrolase PuuD